MNLLNFRELKEDLGTLQGKEVEVTHRKGDLEKQLEVSIHTIYCSQWSMVILLLYLSS